MRYAAEQGKSRARAIFLFFARPTTTLVRAADFSVQKQKRTPKTNYLHPRALKTPRPALPVFQVNCFTENGDERQKWRRQGPAAGDDRNKSKTTRTSPMAKATSARDSVMNCHERVRRRFGRRFSRIVDVLLCAAVSVVVLPFC